jgi:hypothetical protein
LKNALGDSILLSPDEEKKLDVVCRFDNTEGPFGLRVRNVYKRVTASGDSTTVERLGSDITWWAEGRH